jgi:hypothetical protein
MELSISRINDFLGCPWAMHMFLTYGLVSTADKDATRIGTLYHKLHEIATEVRLGYDEDDDPSGAISAEVTHHLNKIYKDCPDHKTMDEWAVERTMILYGFLTYNWHYSDQPYDILGTELAFGSLHDSNLPPVPIIDPDTGEETGAFLKGRIDNLVKVGRQPMIHDFKSTGRNIHDKKYWVEQNSNMQMKSYIYAARWLQQNGYLEDFGLLPDDLPVKGALIDAWKRPAATATMLTQAKTKAFLETKEYYGTEFEITSELGETEPEFYVDGDRAMYKAGAKEGSFALRETVDMMGVRLLDTMTDAPEDYFQRREMPITKTDMYNFQKDLCNIVQTIGFHKENDTWYHNRLNCRKTYTCSYVDICDYNKDVSNGEVPTGFRCVFDKEKE